MGEVVSKAFRSGAGETPAVDCGPRALHSRWLCVAVSCLAAASGESDVTIASRLSVNRNTVILWRKRFAMERLDGLVGHRSRPRTKAPFTEIEQRSPPSTGCHPAKPNRRGMTLHTGVAGPWHRGQGVSKSTVNNISGAPTTLQPHLARKRLSFRAIREVSGKDDRCGGSVLKIPRNRRSSSA